MQPALKEVVVPVAQQSHAIADVIPERVVDPADVLAEIISVGVVEIDTVDIELHHVRNALAPGDSPLRLPSLMQPHAALHLIRHNDRTRSGNITLHPLPGCKIIGLELRRQRATKGIDDQPPAKVLLRIIVDRIVERELIKILRGIGVPRVPLDRYLVR